MTRHLLSVAVLLVMLMGAIAYMWTAEDVESPPAQAADPREDALDEDARILALARNVSASRRAEDGAPESVVAQAPPWASDAQPVDPSDSRIPPIPPEGYSFTPYFGEMEQLPLDPAVNPPKPPVDAGAVDFWLKDSNAVARLVQQAAEAGRDWTFGYLKLARGVHLEDMDPGALASVGLEVMGASGDLVRAKLPGSGAALKAVFALPQVSALGAVPPDRKVAASFLHEADERPAGEETPVFITLMAGDADGRWRDELRAMGVTVGHFHADIRVCEANLPYGALRRVTGADFVLGVEPVGVVNPAHDTLVPAMGADALREFSSSSELFSGVDGAEIPVGVMDTGLNTDHVDIAFNRRSICGANFVTDAYLFGNIDEQHDLWFDRDGHGTHVTGTLLGAGRTKPELAGIAPGVRDIRFAKVLAAERGNAIYSALDGMDFFARPTRCEWSGTMSDPVKPKIVNMSLARSGLNFEGRTVSERKLDAIVWAHKQLYVVAASNSGENAFSDLASAKSSLAVGAVADSGEIASFSSHGPTRDGRLLPQVTAVGVAVSSAKGAGSRTAYERSQGTSMAAPAAAGVAALLMDAVPATRDSPAAARALLMATAIKPAPIIASAAQFARDNTRGPGPWQNQYGMGKVSARTAVLERDSADGWSNGFKVAEIASGSYAYADIVVPSGASRLDIVVTWDEPPADTITDSVLNDFDLWVDRGNDCAESAAKCGEYSSRSRRDNVEWVIVRNPQPGTYRAKIVADQVYSGNQAAIAWHIIRGAAAPRLTIAADSPSVRAGQNEQFEVSLTVTADEYVAAGVTLQPACRWEGTESRPDPDCAARARLALVDSAGAVTREDAIDRPVEKDPFDALVSLGELAAGEQQTVTLAFRHQRWWPSHRLYFVASAWNADGDSATVGVDLHDTTFEGNPGIPEEVADPAHATPEDAFALRGPQGRVNFDLVRSSRAPGEPILPPDEPSDKNKVLKPFWFSWRAEETVNTRYVFYIENQNPDDDVLIPLKWDVFTGSEISDLEHVFPEDMYIGTGVTYAGKIKEGDAIRVRLSTTSASSKPYVLRWVSRDTTPPDNDGFADATTISGESGKEAGDNGGATLETGEDFAGMAASAWYRWKAPADGHWRFRVRQRSINAYLRVLVFEGDEVAGLRLVSGPPRDYADFLAGSGDTYRVAVVAADAQRSVGGSYELNWTPFDKGRQYLVNPNDHFAGAQEIAGDQGRYSLDPGGYSTVEPDEPEATGTRTRWLAWTPDEAGEYTFRLHDLTPVLQDVAFFSGDALDDLQLLAASDRQLRSRPELKVAVESGETYVIAVGIRGQYAFRASPSPRGLLEWGATPANDDIEGADRITGTEGSLTVSPRFATVESGELSDVAGHQSLWWEWRAGETGWQRFRLDDASSEGAALSLYVRGSGGNLKLVGTSELSFALNGAAEVVFEAVAGRRYLLRLTTGAIIASDVVIRWEESAAPRWLRYVGRVLDGDPRVVENGLDLRFPGPMALNAAGDRLYLSGYYGLATFVRNDTSGALAPSGFVWSGERGCDSDSDECAYAYLDPNTPLLWDPARTRLYSADPWYDVFHKFLPDRQGGLVAGGPILSADGVSPRSGVDLLLMDSDGDFLHALETGGSVLDTFSLNDDGESTWVEVEHLARLRHAVVSEDGEYLYAVTDERLLAFDRDTETGEIDRAPGGWRANGSRFVSVAMTPDQSRLQVLREWNDLPVPAVDLYDLAGDPGRPEFRAQLASFSGYPSTHATRANNDPPLYCTTILARDDSQSADILCRNAAFTVTWNADAEELYATDYISAHQADRFGNEPPSFGWVRGGVASPDGRHVYVTGTEEDQILIFERIGGD